MLWSLFLLCLWQPSPDASFQEWVYHAEVYGEVDAALEHLQPLHDQIQNPLKRQQLAHGIAIVRMLQKQSSQSLTRLLSTSRSVIIHGGMRRIYADGQWFAVGDWFDNFYLEEIYFDRLLLKHRDGHDRVLPLTWQNFNDPDLLESGLLMEAVPAAELLAFISHQAQMSYFIPGSLEQTFTGYVPQKDWLLMLEALGEQFQIRWTRHQDNIVFHELPTAQYRYATLPLVELENEPLGLFLAALARRLNLNLMLSDASLADINIDIRLESQPWNEVLDCLGIMSNFSWHLMENGRGSRRILFIQKNDM